MKDVKYMTGCSAERLMQYCREATDDSWYDARPGAYVARNKSARVFVRNGCKVTIGATARLYLYSGAFFILGNFTMMPRSDVQLFKGMMVLGGGYLGFGSILSCDEKLWIVGADIAPMCYVSDTDGHRIREADGSEAPMWQPTILHEHVFIGPGSTVLKGSEIGAGTVVGPKSLVRGMLPEACYAEGVPAVPVSNGITWTRREMNIEETL